MTHELMIPRIMVKVDHPHSPLEKGEVLEMLNEVYVDKRVTHAVTPEDVEKHTDVFRVMPWWEGRELSEMPEYVKRASGIVFKPKWVWSEQEKCFLAKAGYHNTGITPATESEYLTYKNQTK